MMEKLNVKKILMFFLAFMLTVMSLSPAMASAAPNVNTILVFVQNKQIQPKVAPVIQGGRLYIEFRSVVLALGFKFNYDATTKVITAVSENESFKIDLKSRKTYLNGRQFTYGPDAPVILGTGANVLVMNHLLNATNSIIANYDSVHKDVNVYEDLEGKPNEADLKKIRAAIEAYYHTSDGLASIKALNIESWGMFTTMLADITIRKSGTELLDRTEHATIKMLHATDKSWIISDVQSETEYLNYLSLAQKEAVVPDADKLAIHILLDTYVQAINDEDALGLMAVENPNGAFFTTGNFSKEQLKLLLEIDFLRDELKQTKEQATIVAYEPDKATVYTVYTVRDKEDASLPTQRSYYLVSVIKTADGKWYMDSNEDVLLGSEIVK